MIIKVEQRVAEQVIVGAVVATGAGVWVGQVSPGLLGCVLYAAIQTVAYSAWIRSGKRFWTLLVWAFLVILLMIAPLRVLCVAVRELGADRFHLGEAALGLAAGWLFIAGSSLSLTVFGALVKKGRFRV